MDFKTCNQALFTIKKCLTTRNLNTDSANIKASVKAEAYSNDRLQLLVMELSQSLDRDRIPKKVIKIMGFKTPLQKPAGDISETWSCFKIFMVLSCSLRSSSAALVHRTPKCNTSFFILYLTLFHQVLVQP